MLKTKKFGMTHVYSLHPFQLLHLWTTELMTQEGHATYMAAHASPIQYENLSSPHPLDFYQTLFSFEPGSSEMPSAGRGFTPELVDRLLEKGVIIAPILLHTGGAAWKKTSCLIQSM